MTVLKRRTRGMTKGNLSSAWVHFLTTGQYFGLKELFPDITLSDHFHIFQLGNPSGGYREKLRVIWTRHREEVLADWKRQKRRGKPWAAKEFDII